jgi:hypothetical protein
MLRLRACLAAAGARPRAPFFELYDDLFHARAPRVALNAPA